MKKRPVIGTLALCAILLLATGCGGGETEAPPPAETAAPVPATEPATGNEMSIQLTGANEVPGPGDPDGNGTASVTLNPGEGNVCFEITVENIGEPTAGHIHSGAAGASGPPVVNFDIANNGLSGCVEVDSETIQSIQAAPADYYVNVHTAEFGPGAVRGQLGM